MMRQAIEQQAIEAHRHGEGWGDFFERNREAIRQAEPYDRQRYRRLIDHLLSLVVSGDTNGMVAIGDHEPWLADERLAMQT